MAKVSKNFRLSPVALIELQELQAKYPQYNQTELVEKAINLLNAAEMCDYASPRALDSTFVYRISKVLGFPDA